MPTNITTTDYLLSGKIVLKQWQEAYRVGTDAILLASLVGADKKGETALRVLDLGAGVGAVSLCVLQRLKNATAVSIEKSSEYYKLSLENAELNNFCSKRYQPLVGDLSDFPHLNNTFDIVVTNPPYYRTHEGRKSKNELKNLAHIESSATLQDFVDYGYKFLKPKGKLIVIQRSLRLLEVLNSNKAWSSVVIHPIFSYETSTKAERSLVVLTKGCKGSASRLRKSLSTNVYLEKGIIMHNPDGSYTPRAYDIIHNGVPF